MRSFCLTVVTALALGITTTSQAECFGEAADAYGCGIAGPQEGSLVSFGAQGQSVTPRYARASGSPFDGLFSAQEHRQMLRGIVINNMNGSRSASNTFNRAVNSNARALRKSNNRRVNVFFGGYGYGY